MVDGWRNRFMAPVYALVISFVFAFILGATLDNPMTRIRFVIAGQNGLPAVLQNSQIRVTPDGGESQPARRLGPSGEFTLPTPDGNITICTTLPAGWSAKDAVIRAGESCLTVDAPGKEVEITLAQEVS